MCIRDRYEDDSLSNCWLLAKQRKGGYFTRDGILYHKDKIFGQIVEQLCLPLSRRVPAMKLSHETYGGNLGYKKSLATLKLSFTWPIIAADVRKLCETCDICQKRRRYTCYDRTPISPVPCNEAVIDSWVMDCLGP